MLGASECLKAVGPSIGVFETGGTLNALGIDRRFLY